MFRKIFYFPKVVQTKLPTAKPWSIAVNQTIDGNPSWEIIVKILVNFVDIDAMFYNMLILHLVFHFLVYWFTTACLTQLSTIPCLFPLIFSL